MPARLIIQNCINLNEKKYRKKSRNFSEMSTFIVKGKGSPLHLFELHRKFSPENFREIAQGYEKLSCSISLEIGQGFAYESLRDQAGKRTAIVQSRLRNSIPYPEQLCKKLYVRYNPHFGASSLLNWSRSLASLRR